MHFSLKRTQGGWCRNKVKEKKEKEEEKCKLNSLIVKKKKNVNKFNRKLLSFKYGIFSLLK